MLEIIIKSIIIGAIGGAAIAAGAARMFAAPKLQAMGAFRTLGELNACNGDPVAHASFGLSFFIGCAGSVVGTGCIGQDAMHRVIPNFAAAVVTLKNRKERLQDPLFMAVAGAGVGVVVITLLNTAAALIPKSLATVVGAVLVPAGNNLLLIAMPLLFLWAAMDSGITTGVWSIVLGGLMMLMSGNSLPGIIFGILIGNSAEEKGYKNKTTRMLMIAVFVLIVLIAYFRGFFKKLGL
jgi:uncharacterized protein (TIGR03580 family)